jgi:hypothetical protein
MGILNFILDQVIPAAGDGRGEDSDTLRYKEVHSCSIFEVKIFSLIAMPSVQWA